MTGDGSGGEEENIGPSWPRSPFACDPEKGIIRRREGGSKARGDELWGTLTATVQKEDKTPTTLSLTPNNTL
ncbi:hypothetical protein NQZ68_014478 [Dissostichus eleginoides]|nr:hypothetical protein NQZ68_014478 [Dissostichus eleginoides]